jgi:hypothetical protein
LDESGRPAHEASFQVTEIYRLPELDDSMVPAVREGAVAGISYRIFGMHPIER